MFKSLSFFFPVVLVATTFPTLTNAMFFPEPVESNHPLIQRQLARFQESFQKDVVLHQGATTQAEHRDLQEDCDLDTINACVLGALFGSGDSLYGGGCPGLFNEVEGAWCTDTDINEWVCCGTESDCCEANVGAITGVSIGSLIGLIIMILGCCYCCKCCCCVSLTIEKQLAIFLR